MHPRERASQTKVSQPPSPPPPPPPSPLPPPPPPLPPPPLSPPSQRYEQLAEQEEQSYQQLRRKLYSELQQERDKAAVEMQTQHQFTEGRMREMKVSIVHVYGTLGRNTLQLVYLNYYRSPMRHSWGKRGRSMRQSWQSCRGDTWLELIAKGLWRVRALLCLSTERSP